MNTDEERPLIQAALDALKCEQLPEAEAHLRTYLERPVNLKSVRPDTAAMYAHARKTDERAWRMKRRHFWEAARDLSKHKRLSNEHLAKLMRWSAGARYAHSYKPERGRAKIVMSWHFARADSAVAHALLWLSARPEQFVVCEGCGAAKLHPLHVVGRKNERFCGDKCRRRVNKREERARDKSRARAKHKQGEGR